MAKCFYWKVYYKINLSRPEFINLIDLFISLYFYIFRFIFIILTCVVLFLFAYSESYILI